MQTDMSSCCREAVIGLPSLDVRDRALAQGRMFGVSAFGTDLGLRIMEGLGLVAVT